MGRLKNKKTLPVFKKPSATLSSEHGKAWQNVRADQLEVGDIVANLGAVIYTQVTCRDEILIEAGYPQSREFWYRSDELVYAFTKKR
jgi:hypothetical protein